jgi:hypothetical protein
MKEIKSLSGFIWLFTINPDLGLRDCFLTQMPSLIMQILPKLSAMEQRFLSGKLVIFQIDP